MGVTTVTTTPCPTTTPCTTPAPTTVTTTPGATVTTTPGATVTTTPGTIAPVNPCFTVAPPAPAGPCGTVAPAAKFALEQKADEKKNKSLFQRLGDTPITTGIFGLLLASAAIGMIVRSYRRSTRMT